MADKNLFISSLCAGGMAGFVVDVVLFPLDTLKTRLQARDGFWKNGGFKGIYKGIGPQAIGSAPQAAIFFCTYETFKATTTPYVSSQFHPFIHMTGASIAEMVCCLVRVPVEIVKQRRQTMVNVPAKSRMSSMKIFINAYKTEGIIGGLYRGFGSTVLREVPFSFIQFPILEYLKELYRKKLNNNIELEPWEVAICGSIAGGISAAVTTPLDVIKTRIMLAPISMASQPGALKMRNVFKRVYKENGIKGLFAGFVPRVVWMTLGGFIFFGMYDLSKRIIDVYLESNECDPFIQSYVFKKST